MKCHGCAKPLIPIVLTDPLGLTAWCLPCLRDNRPEHYVHLASWCQQNQPRTDPRTMGSPWDYPVIDRPEA